MRPDKITKSEAAFASDKEVKRNLGYTDIKRDGLVKDISTSLYDVDYAIKWHLENIITPTIVEENTVITVPIMFAAGEKWASVQKHGFLRDSQGKLLTPLIMIRRNSVTKREDIQDLKVLDTSDNRITFERKYTQRNRYSRFDISQRPKEKEYYSMSVPKFMQVEYEILCWTNNTVQLNEIVEQLIWFDGKAFGDAHKFITHIDPPAFENINDTGTDRVVRATLSMRTKAHILNTHGPNAPSFYKLNPVNKIIAGIEIDGVTESVSALADTTPRESSTTLLNGFGSRNSGGGGVGTAALNYLNMNRQLTGTVVNSTTVTFASGWETAPQGMPATSIDNFTFLHKQSNWEQAASFIPRSAIVSFTQSNGISTLVVNTANLDYSLVAGDYIIGIGKFLVQDSLA
jgi:hypothetical protein